MTQDDLIQAVARSLARSAAPHADPDVMWPYEGHGAAAPRWFWHVDAAKAVLAWLALAAL